MLYTIQMAQWSKLPLSIKIIDITAKSGGKPWIIFAPTWNIISDYKDGRITEQEYTDRYYNLMRNRYKTNRDTFQELISRAICSDVALACYCPKGEFCHRVLLKDILLKIEPLF